MMPNILPKKSERKEKSEEQEENEFLDKQVFSHPVFNKHVILGYLPPSWKKPPT